ncbi:molybdopterin-dependent oxidoreductase [Roseovarius sp. SCSIO 43702]|uniref:molybdopterin-dependent oxidoreductase n=1 Tax=Roseovarius sp. SCSIO 43702 TaxID=2823043 RepID=UPI001C72DD96|nr:molybdopterin-dependent oxidoreductase [Roseovarius sp. SCSIO 43702]QYX56446.1 molybdopterin-dependent oxidoreductase [Roseovarius sp. SCSIO 43702]
MQNPVAIGLAMVFLAAPVGAQETAPVLRITGNVAGGAVELDMDTLRALPQVTLETSTVVTDGTHRFTGVLMRDLLDMVEADGDQVTATALNDYAVDIPVSDFRDYDVVVAHAMDDEPLDRADKGPLWIVYPRDDHAELQDIRYDYRWVWQLSGLDVQ